MPEGVEVRKFADSLKNNILDASILSVKILKGRYTKKAFDGFKLLEESLPCKVKDVSTKGKFIYITLESVTGKTLYILNTLGLTGGWTVYAKDKKDFNKTIKTPLEVKYLGRQEGLYTYPIIWEYISNNNLSEWFEKALDHLNVEFSLDNGMSIYFYDQLSFGTLKVIDTKSDLDKKLKELGPDILDETTTYEIFNKQINKGVQKEKMIGNVIVNQKVISGIGNYLRADALWMAKINPFRIVKDLTDDEKIKLYKSLRALTWGDYNYDDAKKRGFISKDLKIPRDYDRDFFVYRHEKDIDGNKVVKEELFEGSQKRFIYWVEEVQK